MYFMQDLHRNLWIIYPMYHVELLPPCVVLYIYIFFEGGGGGGGGTYLRKKNINVFIL